MVSPEAVVAVVLRVSAVPLLKGTLAKLRVPDAAWLDESVVPKVAPQVLPPPVHHEVVPSMW